jgi:hypothetical protein
MVDANKIIEDIIKGAQQTEGFMRGGTVGIERQILGEETKLSGDHAGLGAALGGPIGAAIGAESGHRGDAALGSLGGGLAGGVAGGGAGALIGLLARNPALAAQLGIGGGNLGGFAGSIYGAHEMGKSHSQRFQDKLSADNALPAAYFAGAKEACDHFKVGFAGLAAGLAGLATKAAPLATKALANPTVRSLGAQAGGGAAMQAGMNAMAPKQ